MREDRFVPIKTDLQHEALLNEIKGNIFEYLVASLLAREYSIESQFLTHFGGLYKDQLLDYQRWIQEHRPELLRKLPTLASRTSNEIKLFLGDIEVDEIRLLGKYAASGDQKEIWNETDILIVSGGKLTPISLKLCKGNAYVNTKSGGVRSFISKYFSNMDDAPKWQDKLNHVVDEQFNQMAHKLHDMAGLSFSGGFDESWTLAGHSELPGELPSEMNTIVVSTYHKMAEILYEALYNLYEKDLEVFSRSLMSLLGMGQESMVQVSCFHKKIKESLYELDSIEVHDYDQMIEQIKTISFPELKKGISSFEIELPSFILQLRVKPMNKFTTCGIKINCAVKYKKGI